MMKSPQQQIYDAVFKASLGLGYSTHDHLPPESEAYPFVYIGEQFDQDRNTKTAIFGDVQQTVHVYGRAEDRATVTGMMDALKTEIRKLRQTENFDVRSRSVTARTIHENTGSAPLIHGMIETTITFN